MVQISWTTPKTWSVGETLTAANMNTHVRDNLNAVGPIIKVRKTADESVTSNATPQNDDHLSFAIAASEIWEVRGRLSYTNNNVANSQIRMTWSVPSGATGFWTTLANGASGASFDNVTDASLTGNIIHDRADTGDQPILIFAVIVNSTNAGTVQFQWAQSVSSGTATTVRANSYLLGTRLSP